MLFFFIKNVCLAQKIMITAILAEYRPLRKLQGTVNVRNDHAQLQIHLKCTIM